jgi:hypothetical protein
MKSWVRTGFLSVFIYLTIFLFNYVFVRELSGELLMLIVTAPVYVLLQMFGIVNPGVYFFIGIIVYFSLGMLIDLIGQGLLKICDKLPHCHLRKIFK